MSNNLHKDDNCNVIQHVDYRSKTDLRKKELEDLRKQSITKSKGMFFVLLSLARESCKVAKEFREENTFMLNMRFFLSLLITHHLSHNHHPFCCTSSASPFVAAKLQDAEAPSETELLHFLEKQRELFVKQRQNQKAAMNYLHQYRADDEFILRDNNNNKATTPTKQQYYHNRTSYGSALSTTTSPIREPDARASIYSYYPPTVVSIDNNHTTTSHHYSSASNNNNNNNNNKPQSTPTLTDQSSTTTTMSSDDERILRWMTTRATAHAFEAARIPLPDDDDNITMELRNKNNNDHLKDDNEVLEEPTTLIVEGNFYGEYDDDETAENAPTSINHDIPFESFLRLGTSQIMDRTQTPTPPPTQEQQQPVEQTKDDSVYCDDDDDNDSVIPSESFMKLGSIMSGSSRCSDDNIDNNEEEDTAPLTDAGQSHDKQQQQQQESSQHATKSNTKESNSVDDTDTSKSSPIAQECQNTKSEYLDNTKIVSSVTLSSIETNTQNNPMKDSTISALSDDSLPDQKSSFLEENEIAVQADRTAESPPNDIDEEKDQESSKSIEGFDVHKEPVGSNSTQHQDTTETTTSNIISTSEPLVVVLESNTIETAANETQENGGNSGHVSLGAHTTTANAVSQPHTRRRKKKKKKDDGYYPTTSIFASRHLFSR